MNNQLRHWWAHFSKIFGLTVFHPQYLVIQPLSTDLKKAGKLASGVLVDLGCGQKPYEKYFREHVESYIGLDYPDSPESKVFSAGTSAQIFADAIHIPLKDNCVDTLLCTQVLEHVATPEELMLEIKRVVRPNGTVIMTVPFMYPIHSAPFDFHRFTRFGLKNLFLRNNFEIIQFTENGGSGRTLALLTNMALLHTLKNLLNVKWLIPLAAILGPIVLLTTCILNIMGTSGFRSSASNIFVLNYTIIARNIG